MRHRGRQSLTATSGSRADQPRSDSKLTSKRASARPVLRVSPNHQGLLLPPTLGSHLNIKASSYRQFWSPAICGNQSLPYPPARRVLSDHHDFCQPAVRVSGTIRLLTIDNSPSPCSIRETSLVSSFEDILYQSLLFTRARPPNRHRACSRRELQGLQVLRSSRRFWAASLRRPSLAASPNASILGP